MAPTYDAIIIGAGMSGLAAGIRLAQFDQRVLILEKHTLFGGLNSFYKRKGRRFDVGLHALTNYAPKGARGVPLTKILRQLRLRWDDLALGEQSFSEMVLGETRLRFSNDFELLRAEVAATFPGQQDAFEQLIGLVEEADAYRKPKTGVGARSVLREIISEPRLLEMLLLPTCYYGSAREDDVDWYQFVILFRSLFQEGLARPEGGIKPLLDLLVSRYRELGGELRNRSGVSRILQEDGRCLGVQLESGEELFGTRVFSSAGWGETLELVGTPASELREERGRLSFVESIFVLDRQPAELGCEATLVFFCDDDHFEYRRPARLTDPRSGVFCCPSNYATEAPESEGILRLTTLANHPLWCELDEAEYAAAKTDEVDAALDRISRYAFDPRPHTVYRDTFTPRTVEHFTGRVGGAVYGAPTKRLDGATPLEHLYLIGTDQGFLGVTGAMMSGISMANRYALQPAQPNR
jgi:phytoene dehydrogenase-like protein